VCYSVQTAAYAHTILRLKNIEAYSLLWGMSGVPGGTDKWSGNTSNDYADHANWSTAASEALPSFKYPKLDTGKEDAEDILDARIEAVLADWGSALVPASTVMGAPGNYNIMTYWAENDWNTYGHIAGAYQLTPKTLTKDANLSAFDPDGNNVLYCWTGQTAAATISYLKVLGYNVQSIKFGVNSMIYDELQAHKWSPPSAAQQ
jgi:rhodanese-related sulfurtransferase